jgi:hypothetical protein
MPLTTIQKTRINNAPFYFENSETVSYPVKPLVSATLFDNKGIKTIKIRATLFINSEDSNEPFIQPNPKTINNSLQLFFDYNFSEETPESCNVWYFELDYTSENVSEITSISSYLKDIDPETSRGTKTGVTP